MKASTLIKKLQAMIDKHGDLPVHMPSGYGSVSPGEIDAYDEDGGYEGEIVEIYIHMGARSVL